MLTDTPAPRVSFVVDDDSHALTISSVLEAMGFEAHRSMESANALHWGCARLVRKYKLTDRERAVLELILTEQLDDKQMGRRLRVAIVTAARLREAVLIKTCTNDREQLLRLALQLPAIQA